MKIITKRIKKFFSRFVIDRPEDFKLHIVRLFRIIGIPALLYFTAMDFINRQIDEAIFTSVILIAFIISTRLEINPRFSKYIYRISLGLLTGNFVYVIASNPDPYLASLWIFLIPLPVALLFGTLEGMIWITVSGIAALLAISSSIGHDPVPTTFAVRYGFVYLVIGILSLTAEHVRKTIQDLYLNKQEELRDFNESISGKVMLDSLTTAYNRSFLTELFPGLLQFANDTNTPLSIVLCDIDQFKTVNDSYGHVQGDHILKSTADVFLGNLRSATDNLVRYGGDEFLIVLRDAKLNDAAGLAERLRIRIKNLTFTELEHGITCSFGVAQLKPTDFEEEGKLASVQLVARADKCLYQAKHQGKNQVVAQCEDE